MKPNFLARALACAIVGAFYASGCRSTTDSSAEALSIVFFQGCCLQGQLMLTSADGAARRELLDSPDAFIQYPRWSPDGQQIVFRRQSSNPQGPGGTFIINVDGSGLRELLPPAGLGMAGADWSPDGSRIVTYAGNGIATIRPDGSGFTPLPATNVYPVGWGISWSPDGNEILYNGHHDVNGYSGAPDVWVFNIATGVSRLLATPGLDARWSPDGRRVAYIETSGIGDRGGLIVINSDGSNPKTLVPRAHGGPPWPEFSWSPDGRKLLYVAELTPCGCAELNMISVDGGASTAISEHPAGAVARHPDWRRTP